MLARRLTALALAVAAALVATPAGAKTDRQVILVLVPGRPYEEALRDPELQGLLRNGGIGLMTTAGETQEPAQVGVSLGAGRSAEDAPQGLVPFEPEDEGITVDAEPYREAAGDAEPGLMATALAESGHGVGYIDLEEAAGDPAMLAGMDVTGRIPFAFLNDFPVLSELPAEFASPEAAAVVEEANLIVSPDVGVIPFVLERSSASDALVIVVSAPPSDAMLDAGDTVTPVIMASSVVGGPLRRGPLGLTSETTKREGLVANVDIAPTILEFLGVPVPGEMVGSPVTFEGTPPGDLHERYLQWREVVTPVGQVVLGLAILALLVGLVLIFGPWHPPKAAIGAAALSGLFAVACLVALVPASLLPTFDWPVVIAAVAGGGALLTVLALVVSGRSATGPLVLVAVTGLALIVVDVAAGWRTGLTPLLGGSALDGERFFGLGNPYAGIVLSGAVLGAARLRLGPGVALLAGVALFAGLPFLGADVGGCITIAAVAGLWYGMARWKRLGLRTWALAAAAAVIAVGVLIVSHKLLPPGETHVSRTISESGGVFGAVEVFWNRLMLNIRSTSETPSAWLAILGLPVILLAALRPPARLKAVLADDASWGRAVAVLSIGGMLGYVLNDTFGMAGMTFTFVSAAIVYPALATRWRGEALREKEPRTTKAAG